MQPEGEIAFAVQVCDGILEKGSLPVFIEVGMEDDVDKRLQTLIGNLHVLHQIKDRILLLQDRSQIEGKVGLGKLIFDVRQGIIRSFVTQEAKLAGDSHQHLTDAVNLFQDKVFQLLKLLKDSLFLQFEQIAAEPGHGLGEAVGFHKVRVAFNIVHSYLQDRFSGGIVNDAQRSINAYVAASRNSGAL